ncbi:MAG: ATP-binding protein [Patescibacteria group bacterium]
MNSFTISTLITASVSLIFGVFVIYRNNKSLENRFWSLVCFGVFVWQLGLFLELLSKDESQALFWNKFLNVGAILIPIFYYNFVLILLNKLKNGKKLLNFGYILALFFLCFNLFTSLFVKGVPPAFNFKYWVEPGILYYPYFVYFALYFIFSFHKLILALREYKFLKKQQIKYVLLSGLFGVGGGVTVFFPQFFGIYPTGNYFVILYLILVTYAMAKYRFMNIRLILTRSILYAILVGTVASFFALSVLVIGNAIGGNTQTSKIITYIVTSFIVVVFLDPVKRTWAKVTDKVFYRGKIDYQEVFREVGNVVAREIDLYKLLAGASSLLADKLKIKQVAFFVPNDKQEFYLFVSSDQEKQKFSLSKDFVTYLEKNRKILIIDEVIRDLGNLDEKSEQYQTADYFIKEAEAHKAEMIVPIVENDNITAIILFDAKQSGDLYGQDDINFLEVFVPQVATAIEKSKLYEEVEAFNKELQQKVDEKTKSLKEVNVALQARNKFLTTIQVVTNMISRTLDLKKINQMIADSIATELGYVGGMLSFVDRENKYLKVGAITNNDHTRQAFHILSKEPRDYQTKLEENYNLSAQTFLTGKINFSDKLSDFLAPPVGKAEIDKIQEILGIKTIVGVPVFSEARIIGLIQYYLPIKRDKISSLDIEIMTALTNQVGLVSRNLKLYNTLQEANADLQDANTRLRELDKAKSEFLSIASHQLRTPISAIKGYLSMMIDGDFGPLPKNINDVIKNLFESAARLARLINIFLNVSRIESGRLKLEKKPIQINELIDSVIIELINQAKQKKVSLEYKKKKTVPPLIMADADKLREVVLNLVDNAIKYTPEGSIVVTVEADNDELNFKVTDTGIGIKKEEVKTLFRKFVRGSGVAQIHTGGSGLGLFIAQKIIKEHDGQVWAESEGSGKGSVFQFTLPVYKENGAPIYKEETKITKK